MALRRSSTTIDLTGLSRLTARVSELSGKQLTVMLKRAGGTLARRLPVEASRLVAAEILNAPRTKIRPLMSAKESVVGNEVAVKLNGLRKRIPLHEFIGARWPGPKSAGAVVKVWKDSPAKVYDRDDSAKDTAVFAKRGGGVKGGLFQRVHNRKGERSPIVLRKGPELWRAITDQEHGDIYPRLLAFGRLVLSNETARLLKGPR